MTLEEGARSLHLPTNDETAQDFPRWRVPEEDPEDGGYVDTDTVPSTIEYPGDIVVDLVMLDDSSWRLVDETSKLASIASYCWWSTWMGSSL